MTTTTGSCPVCGQRFTTESSQRPRRRYCSDRCRKLDWRRHHHTTHQHHPVDAPRPGAVPRPGTVTDDVVAPPGASAPRCPHCTRPVAVISLLVAPAAAQIPTPAAGYGC